MRASLILDLNDADAALLRDTFIVDAAAQLLTGDRAVVEYAVAESTEIAIENGYDAIEAGFAFGMATVDPVSRPAAGGGSITITIENLQFYEVLTVAIDGNECTDVVQTGNDVTCTVPAHAAAAGLDIVITFAFGNALTNPAAFEYV